MEIPEEYRIGDDEIKAAWGNANFGNSDKRDVISETLLQVAGGFHVGHTAMSICADLGLLIKRRGQRLPYLTKKGKRAMYYMVMTKLRTTKEEPKELVQDAHPMPDKKDNKEDHLKAFIVDGKFIISIGIDTLSHATMYGPKWPEGWKITDREKFAEGIISEALSEAEDGTTLIHEMFDMAALEALEQGAEGADLIKCRECGCDNFSACMIAQGGCHWVEEDLCSTCKYRATLIAEGEAP